MVMVEDEEGMEETRWRRLVRLVMMYWGTFCSSWVVDRDWEKGKMMENKGKRGIEDDP